MILFYIIGVGLKQESQKIEEHPKAKQSNSKEIKNTTSYSSFIESVRTKYTKEETKQKCNPLILHTTSRHCNISVDIAVCVRIIDDNARLLSLLKFFDLTTAQRANYCLLRNFAATHFAELGRHIVLLYLGVLFILLIIHTSS